jgi:hypothetical protein
MTELAENRRIPQKPEQESSSPQKEADSGAELA